jgi:hypothetical protein
MSDNYPKWFSPFNKPPKPYKPIAPKEPQETLADSTLVKTIELSNYDSISLQSIIDQLPVGTSYQDVKIEIEYHTGYSNDIENESRIAVYRTVSYYNEQYKRQLAGYKRRLASYKKKLEEYEKELAQWKVQCKEWGLLKQRYDEELIVANYKKASEEYNELMYRSSK